jgi:hypothetical protein
MGVYQVLAGATPIGYSLSFLRFITGTPFNISSDTLPLTGSSTFSTNKWTHVAITKNNNQMKFWLDGSLIGTRAATGAYPVILAHPEFRIGGAFQGSSGTVRNLNGNMNGVRFLKGTVLYWDNNFVPSLIAPIFDITSTSFLYLAEFGNNYIQNSIIGGTISPDASANSYNFIIDNALNYNTTIFKNVYIKNDSQFFDTLKISATKLEEFRLENCILTGANPPLSINSARTNAKAEGSYIFHNCNSSIYNLSGFAISSYQTDGYKEGIIVMRENGLAGNHYKYTGAGAIALDTVNILSSSDASERLTPWSPNVKLRSTSKFIPINIGESLTISVTLKILSGYTGALPRLMLVSNAALGYYDSVLTIAADSFEWQTLNYTLPAALDTGVIELYVDCSGNVGSGYINIDSWNFY